LVVTDNNKGYRSDVRGGLTRKQVTAFVRHEIERRRSELKDDGGEPSWRAIAEPFGKTHASFHNIHTGKQSVVGADIEEAFARVMFDGSVDALRRAAKEHWDANGMVLGTPHPNLEKAVAKRLDEYHPKTLEYAEKIARQWKVDRRNATAWETELGAYDRAHQLLWAENEVAADSEPPSKSHSRPTKAGTKRGRAKRGPSGGAR